MLSVPWVDLQCVIMVFGDHNHLSFDLTAAGGWDCMAAVERPSALHYSADFVFSSSGVIDSSV